MTFLPSKAGGFLFQTALIKRENKNIAGFCRMFRRAPRLLGSGYFHGGE